MSGRTPKALDQDPSTEIVDSTTEVLKNEYQVDTTDLKNPESLTYVILDLTVNQMYDRAIREVKAYFEYKSSYPTYPEKTERLFAHIENVISAIKTKKNITVISNLPASKRKELQQVIGYHFQDLKQSLQRVTHIEYQMRLRDSRTTLWVVNAFIICSFIIVSFALLREAYDSLWAPFDVIQNDALKWLYRLLGS